MATLSSTAGPIVETTHWRDHIKITRIGIFSICFIIAGALLLLNAPRSIPANSVTTLTFGENLGVIPVTVVPYAIVVGLLYLAGGIVGMLPDERLKRVKFWWLLLNGVLIIPSTLIIVAAGKTTNMTAMLESSFRLATPIVIGALAGIWCERSGVTNIAIEGMMLTGAALGFITFALLVELRPPAMTPQTWTLWAQFIGVFAAIASGGIMALLHAWLSIRYRTDQIVSGTVINILAIGVTSFLRRDVLLSSQAGRETLAPIAIPGLSQLPIVGQVLFTGKPIFYAMFVLLVATHIILYYTRWGLRTRAVGENPHAADTLGINVIRNRWINVFIGGLIAGLAGAWFSLETTGSFDDNMTSGRGFIALAAMIFGKWTPFGAAAGGLLFGFSSALDTRFQILSVNIPPQFVQMTPYIVTMIVLAGLVGKANAPKADGIPYEKE
jgi:simple sugar transport system permease protein